jgi:hypothetical protein
VGKRVLGKGLDALFAGGENLRANENEVDLDSIVVKGNQPRKVFNQESLDEMAVSIKEHGVLQPLLVLPWHSEEVITPWGKAVVKVWKSSDGSVRMAPEYESCRNLAAQAGIPMRRVIDEIMGSYRR